jgi:hypothetical protein
MNAITMLEIPHLSCLDVMKGDAVALIQKPDSVMRRAMDETGFGLLAVGCKTLVGQEE